MTLHLTDSIASLQGHDCRTGFNRLGLDLLRSHLALRPEILALRHQPNVLNRSVDLRRKLRTSERVLWVWLSRHNNVIVPRKGQAVMKLILRRDIGAAVAGGESPAVGVKDDRPPLAVIDTLGPDIWIGRGSFCWRSRVIHSFGHIGSGACMD
jgi:hypothetical protein